MRLNSPKKATFYIAVILGVLGIIAKFVPLGIVSSLSLWLVVAGFVLLALGNCVKGL